MSIFSRYETKIKQISTPIRVTSKFKPDNIVFSLLVINKTIYQIKISISEQISTVTQN